MSDWPVWAKLSAGLGFPILVAVWLGMWISPKIDRTAAAMDQHVSEAQVQTVLLRAICRNTAKTELQATFCEFGRATISRE